MAVPEWTLVFLWLSPCVHTYLRVSVTALRCSCDCASDSTSWGQCDDVRYSIQHCAIFHGTSSAACCISRSLLRSFHLRANKLLYTSFIEAVFEGALLTRLRNAAFFFSVVFLGGVNPQALSTQPQHCDSLCKFNRKSSCLPITSRNICCNFAACYDYV